MPMPTTEGQAKRGHRQLQRGGAVLDDDRRHLSVVVDRRAEIEREGVTEVREVLLDEGLVEACGLAALVQLLLGDAPAQRRLDGIARGDPHQAEDHGEEDQDGGDRKRKPRDHVGAK